MNRVIGKINRIVAPKSSDRRDVLDHAHWTLRTFYLQESPSFLKKNSKTLRIRLRSPWRTEAEIIKSFLLLFFKKEVLSLSALRRGTAPTPALPQSGGGRSGAVRFFSKKNDFFCRLPSL
jgi:hypothetical protein